MQGLHFAFEFKQGEGTPLVWLAGFCEELPQYEVVLDQHGQDNHVGQSHHAVRPQNCYTNYSLRVHIFKDFATPKSSGKNLFKQKRVKNVTSIKCLFLTF